MPFLASFLTVSVALIAAIVPTFGLPGSTPADKPPFPAPPGYLLPWPGGQIHTVTQGEETGLTHNGIAAYAFDINLHFEIVVAARAGRVTMVRQDSGAGGCSADYVNDANYVVIDHGDGTSALYLHLAQDFVLVHPGQFVDQGQPIAASGDTGVTCSEDMKGRGPHLHFQVERTDDSHYFTQSLPIAFDDIAKNGGIPQQDQSYVSGNYGRGKMQKIKLTPHHDPRPFNPVATPADPSLFEADQNAAPPPAASATPEPTTPSDVPADAGTPAPVPTRQPRPTHTPTARPTDTPVPTPTASDTPIPSNTPVPTDTATLPTATSTPVPPVATDTPPPATPTPAATATPTPTPTP